MPMSVRRIEMSPPRSSGAGREHDRSSRDFGLGRNVVTPMSQSMLRRSNLTAHGSALSVSTSLQIAAEHVSVTL